MCLSFPSPSVQALRPVKKGKMDCDTEKLIKLSVFGWFKVIMFREGCSPVLYGG